MINRADRTNRQRQSRRRTGSKALIGALLVAAVCSTVAPSTAAATVYYDGAAGAARIGVIGDSSIAGIRWINTFGPLQSFNFTFDAESCRRTTAASCRGREGYAPENALTVMRRLSGQWGSVLVMGTGYNDPGTTFSSSVDEIMAEAAAQGIPHVMWLTMSTAEVSYVAPTYNSNTYTFRDNNRILIAKAQQYGGRLQIADWASYSAGQRSWFASDGIHFTAAGAAGSAQFIASQAGRVLSGETITPSAPATPAPSAWVTVQRGDRGPLVATVQRALARLGVSVVGGADGIYGSYTEAAVRRFQTSRGLSATGVTDIATATAMGLVSGDGAVAPPPAAPPPAAVWADLRMGSRGATVASAQRAVINSGIFLRGGADGIYGSYTTAAVRQYQLNRGLPQTGVVDAVTATAMGLFTGSGAPTPIPPGSPAPARTYTVVRGDSLYGIARKSGVAIGELLSLNNLALNSLILPGMVLTVAAGTADAAALAAPAGWTDIGPGARGASVAAAQTAIINSGIYLRGGADGVFGQYTQAALRQYQLNRSLPQSGVIDTATAEAMGLYTAPPPTTTTTTTTTVAPATETPTTAAAPSVEAQAATAAVEPMSVSAAAVEEQDATDASATSVEADDTVPTSEVDTTEAAAAESVIGDFVWLDDDGDGLQGDDEAGVENVTVRLVGSGDTVLATTVTDWAGEFTFAGLPAGTYDIEFVIPDDHDVTFDDVGMDNTVDSDAVVDEASEAADERTAIVVGVTVDGSDKNVDTDLGLLESSQPADTAPAQSESESEPESEAAVEDADAAPEPPATTELAIETVASSLPG